MPQKILLIGWDAADWKVIHPLMDRGLMPALQSMVEGGVMGNIATLHPVLSPMLWTSIGTGKRPFKHGIHGFSEPTPDGQQVRPTTNLSRKCKAVWNILSQNGLKSNVVGWWPSHPAEPINGVMVSNHFHRATGPIDQPWPLAPESIHPKNLEAELAELRFHPNELDQQHILQFVPRAAEIDQDKDRRLAGLMRTICDCTSVNAAATHLMETQPWDFMAVYYDSIDHFSHGFMRYHPPRQDFVSEEDFELYKDVLSAGYAYHDLMLRSLLAKAGDDTTVILLSDHGFHPDHLRPRAIPHEPAGPAVEHRDFGVFVMKGPGIKRDELVHGVNLLDVTPTVLTLFGLPLGDDMDGKPVIEAFEQAPEIKRVPSWEDVEGADGRHPPGRDLESESSKGALDQLVDLGYIERPDADPSQAVESTVQELRYNLARSYMDADRYHEAQKILSELYAESPTTHRFGVQLALCFRALEQARPLRRLVDDILARRKVEAEIATRKLKDFQNLLTQRRERYEQARPEDLKEDEKPDARKLLLTKEYHELERLKSLARADPYSLEYLAGYAYLAEGDAEQALERLRKAEKANRQRPALHLQIGEAYLKLRQPADAERAFRLAEEIDPENPHVRLGLARCALRRGQNREAADEASAAVGLMYQFPMAHYCLGVALHRLGRVDESIEELEIALGQNPNFAEAHSRLAMIHRNRLLDPETARMHKEAAQQIRRENRRNQRSFEKDLTPQLERTLEAAQQALEKEQQSPAYVDPEPLLGLPKFIISPSAQSNGARRVITVVSGLPRSGTSLMMQMLTAGGMNALTDEKREADDSNPRGYFELERVKSLHTDRSWLPEAEGKVVKVVAPLLPYLDARLRYRVVFMKRKLDEVIASQRAMLDRDGKQGADLSDEQLGAALVRQLGAVGRMLQSHETPLLEVDYGGLVADPASAIERIRQFVGSKLDSQRMAAAVDPTLYHQRTK